MMLTVSKRRQHPPGYVKETAEINARKKEYAGPHKFKAAKWTHPNGHPRCSLCGDEEIIGGICNVTPTSEDRKDFQQELEEEFGSFTKDFDPNQPRDRLGRWWDGVPRAYGVYDANTSGRATGNDLESRGHGRRRPGASRVASTTAGVTNMPAKATKAQRNKASQWVLKNLAGRERSYASKVIEHSSRGKNVPAQVREDFIAKSGSKVSRERLIEIENLLIGVMFPISKRYIEFTKAKNPLWDGDGVQGVGQPRGAHGRWTDTAGGAVAARVARATASATAGSSLWDHRRKTLASNVKLTRLPHGGQHAIEVNGKRVARKNLTPEQALYQRNNGPTKITNTRLAEIHKDRSKLTPSERDLLMSAGAQAAIDGDDDVKVWVVRDKAYKPRPRYSIIANLRKEIANDVARQSGDTGEGSTKHVTRRTDRTAEQRGAENKKRVESGRNSYARIRKDMVDQFSSDGGKTVRCIFCGKPVAASVASPERMKPGPIGGKYEIGNVAPAHERCNTVAGQVAQYDPELYYDEMMAKFMQMYVKMNAEQKKKMQPIFTKNRKKLGARPR